MLANIGRGAAYSNLLRRKVIAFSWLANRRVLASASPSAANR
jgi:hypothetical protein